MKKLITVLFAMMLMFSMTAFAEEADLTGEWYGTLMGISITMNFNEDGTYAMTMAMSPDDAKEGTWELRDGEVVVDPGTDTEGSFAFDGETLTMAGDDYEMVLTREPVDEFVPAEPAKDAQLEDYEGEWVSGMVEAMGVTVDGKAAGLELKAKVEGTTVTLDSGTLGLWALQISPLTLNLRMERSHLKWAWTKRRQRQRQKESALALLLSFSFWKTAPWQSTWRLWDRTLYCT